MASNMAKVPAMRNFMNRGLATAALKRAEGDLQIDSSSLNNKLQVVSVHHHSPILRVSVQFKAGSRYETSDNLGTTAVLRSACGLATKGASHFAITRIIQERGANLIATNDQDTFAYTLECSVEHLEKCLNILKCVSSQQSFKPWELSDNVPRLKYELGQVPPQARLIDMLHGAAYRTGLGNSLFIPKYLVGSHGSETLQHFVKNTFLSNQAVVSCIGLHHNHVRAFAESLELSEGAGLPTSKTYYGGELRKRGKGLTHIAIATEGAGVNSKEVLAFGVLQQALGTGPSVKWGPNQASPLGKAVMDAAAGETAAVSALNASHVDSGLFGVVLACEPRIAGKVTEAALKVLRSGSVSDEMVKRGKAKLKTAICSSTDNLTAFTEDLGQQVLLTGSAHSPSELASAVDSLSSSDISNAARKIASGKLSLAALGNISHVPFVDQLK